MIGYVLIISELFLTFTHFIVLFDLFSLKKLSLSGRRIYFVLDLTTVILSYYIIKTNDYLIFMHLVIHSLAIIQLYFNYSKFFQDVYEIAEQNYINKSVLTKTAYILGTSEDILTHMVNIYFLSKII